MGESQRPRIGIPSSRLAYPGSRQPGKPVPAGGDLLVEGCTQLGRGVDVDLATHGDDSDTVLLGGAHGEVHEEAPLSVVAAVHGLVTRQGC